MSVVFFLGPDLFGRNKKKGDTQCQSDLSPVHVSRPLFSFALVHEYSTNVSPPSFMKSSDLTRSVGVHRNINYTTNLCKYFKTRSLSSI